jgi:phosphopantothenoylcysteine decarboxylase/phosphopantothenate--cysteine ligase
VLVSGPTHLATTDKVQRVDVETAQQMHAAVMEQISGCDIFIAAAAVSDYRPLEAAQQKIKKRQQTLSLELVRNPDIITDVAKQHPAVFTVGFAAESHDLKQYAIQKLNQKSLNLIVANDISRGDIGFDSKENEVSVYWQGGEQSFQKASKPQIARQLIQLIAEQYNISG